MKIYLTMRNDKSVYICLTFTFLAENKAKIKNGTKYYFPHLPKMFVGLSSDAENWFCVGLVT